MKELRSKIITESAVIQDIEIIISEAESVERVEAYEKMMHENFIKRVTAPLQPKMVKE
jgi:hypothetical protein